MKFNSLRLILILGVITPLGFATKFYSGPGEIWINDYLGGVLYVVFFILIAQLVFTGAGKVKIVIWVTAITFLLETLQLWHPPFLETVRSNFFGRSLIGNGFDWWDFPHYIIGGLAGYLLLRLSEKGQISV